MAFSNAKWIWKGDPWGQDQYVEFVDSFHAPSGKAKIRISVDGDYTLYLNGKFVACNQYGDLEHYKIYDELDLTGYLVDGENRLCILVWHFGKDSQRYVNYAAGLIYEVTDGENCLAHSGAETCARISQAYRSGRQKEVTGQLGFGFGYDASREDGWLREDTGDFEPSEPVEKRCTLFPRPTEKLTQYPYKPGKVLENRDNRHFLLDLGEETVGLLHMEFASEGEQEVLISYGEDLQNGHVRRIIGGRDFSLEYRAKAGENDFTNYMFRLGGRFLELDFGQPAVLKSAGLIPQNFDARDNGYRPPDPLDRDIYGICVNALQKCMMEHYVDTPWREQCLYALDSRNQMLCGYYALEGGNFAYARSNLKLLGQSLRGDGMLPICAPCGVGLTIPSFSLYYVIAMEEYLRYSRDESLAAEQFDVMCTILQTFRKQVREDLVYTFAGADYWNFFDWSQYASGSLGTGEEPTPGLLGSCVLILALDGFARICRGLDREDPFSGLADRLRLGGTRRFYDEETGLFRVCDEIAAGTVLANCMAVCAGLVSGEKAKYICDRIVSDTLIPCSLSMRTFLYDALVKTDAGRYRDYIYNQIRRDYGKMLEAGSTTTWETALGAEDFGNAGSLCHGWSAVPIYYYHTLFKEK